MEALSLGVEAHTKTLPDGGETELPPRRGSRCPQCLAGRLDYDGLLNLRCDACGWTAGGCFT